MRAAPEAKAAAHASDREGRLEGRGRGHEPDGSQARHRPCGRSGGRGSEEELEGRHLQRRDRSSRHDLRLKDLADDDGIVLARVNHYLASRPRERLAHDVDAGLLVFVLRAHAL